MTTDLNLTTDASALPDHGDTGIDQLIKDALAGDPAAAPAAPPQPQAPPAAPAPAAAPAGAAPVAPVAPTAPAAPAAPAAEKSKFIVTRKGKAGTDEIDLEQWLGDPGRRARIEDMLSKGTLYDEDLTAAQRAAAAEAVRADRQQVGAWLKSQGVLDDQGNVIRPQAQASAAPATPAVDLAALKKRATDGDQEALFEYLDAKDASTAAVARQATDAVAAWQRQQQEQKDAAARAAQVHSDLQRADAWWDQACETRLNSRATAFVGPHAAALRDAAKQSALGVLTRSPQLGVENALGAIDAHANALEATLKHVVSPFAARPAPAAPPAMGGGTAPSSSGAPSPWNGDPDDPAMRDVFKRQ